MSEKRRGKLTREHYEAQPKCQHHPKSIATTSSVALGDPLCFRCDPLWEKKPKEYKGTGAQAKRNAEMRYRRGKRYDNLPSNIANLYEITIADRQLVSLHEDIATVEAVIRQIGLDLKDNQWDNRSFFKVFWENWERWCRQIETGAMDVATLIERVNAMRDTVLPKTLLMSEFFDATEMKRKLVDTETNRMNKLGYTPDYVMEVLAVQSGLIAKYLEPAMLERYKIELSNHPVFKKRDDNDLQLLPVSPDEMTTEEKLQAIETKEFNGVYEWVDKKPKQLATSKKED